MNRYETIVSLGENFIKLTGKGLIPIHILDWKVYYESFMKEMDYQKKYFSKPRKTHAVGVVSSQYKITERTMYNIIAFMETR